MSDKKIKLAVVGIGVMGLKHIDAINKVGNAELAAVVEAGPRKATDPKQPLNKVKINNRQKFFFILPFIFIPI